MCMEVDSLKLHIFWRAENDTLEHTAMMSDTRCLECLSPTSILTVSALLGIRSWRSCTQSHTNEELISRRVCRSYAQEVRQHADPKRCTSQAGRAPREIPVHWKELGRRANINSWNRRCDAVPVNALPSTKKCRNDGCTLSPNVSSLDEMKKWDSDVCVMTGNKNREKKDSICLWLHNAASRQLAWVSLTLPEMTMQCS